MTICIYRYIIILVRSTTRKEVNKMTYEIEYILTGSGETKKTDKVIMRTNEEYEFESGVEIPHDLNEIILVFEMIAAKWWGTYENRNAITNIRTLAR